MKKGAVVEHTGQKDSAALQDKTVWQVFLYVSQISVQSSAQIKVITG